ncbi:MAG: DUF1499 domain-containing protein [Nitrospina sp.]|nr:DUF1499 domain-containing protein [Nitrospina sp.]
MSNEQTTDRRQMASIGAFIKEGVTAWKGFGLLVLVPFLLSACSGERPANLGVHSGRLSPCPASPNCVSTHSTEDAEHFIQPLMFSASPADVMKRVRQAVQGIDRAEIISEGDTYLHAEFTSRVLRFVDDVEFYFENKTGTLHVRSASRLGHSDLGVNRERVEEIFTRLKGTDKKPKT